MCNLLTESLRLSMEENKKKKKIGRNKDWKYDISVEIMFLGHWWVFVVFLSVNKDQYKYKMKKKRRRKKMER